jgi:hypothetical protein
MLLAVALLLSGREPMTLVLNLECRVATDPIIGLGVFAAIRRDPRDPLCDPVIRQQIRDSRPPTDAQQDPAQPRQPKSPSPNVLSCMIGRSPLTSGRW